jgi:hypothetical protein
MHQRTGEYKHAYGWRFGEPPLSQSLSLLANPRPGSMGATLEGACYAKISDHHQMALGWTGRVLLLLLIIGSSLNHRLQTPREEAAYPPPGQLVAVNGHRLHVYAEGAGDLTLVFHVGQRHHRPYAGFQRTLSPPVRRLPHGRRGAGGVRLERGRRHSRDIETVLNETRLALTLAGESPPYVLLPHSMSGLEALHWANRYPDEVAAIIGLDPATPPSIDHAAAAPDAHAGLLHRPDRPAAPGALSLSSKHPL